MIGYQDPGLRGILLVEPGLLGFGIWNPTNNRLAQVSKRKAHKEIHC